MKQLSREEKLYLLVFLDNIMKALAKEVAK